MGKSMYQGWKVALGAFLAFTFASFVHTSFGLFVVPASTSLGISRADTNTWLIVMGVGSAFLAPVAGRMLDRFPVRTIMASGGIILALSMYVMAGASSTWLLLLMALPVAFASDSAGGIAAGTVTARWFRKRRGRALALVGIGASAAGFVLSPLIAYLIVNLGWRGALPVIGTISAAVILLMAAFVIRDRPTREQLIESGELNEADEALEATHEQRKWGNLELLTNRNFILLALGAGLLFASDRALMISVAPYLSDGGIDIKMAGLMISALTGSSIVGKLLVGYLADHIDPRRIFLVVAALHIVLLVTFIIQPGYWAMFAVALFAGIGIGGVLPTWQVLTARTFGSASYGMVIGTGAVIQQVLMMAAFRFVGEVSDRTKSYDAAFMVFIGMVFVSALFIWLTSNQHKKQAA